MSISDLNLSELLTLLFGMTLIALKSLESFTVALNTEPYVPEPIAFYIRIFLVYKS